MRRRLGDFHPEPLADSGREPLDSSGRCRRAKAAALSVPPNLSHAARRGNQPPAQYVQPASWARLTPHTPDGITVIPAMTLAVNSFSASSGVTPAFLASRLAWPRS